MRARDLGLACGHLPPLWAAGPGEALARAGAGVADAGQQLPPRRDGAAIEEFDVGVFGAPGADDGGRFSPGAQDQPARRL